MFSCQKRQTRYNSLALSASWTCVETWVGLPNGLTNLLASTRKSHKTHFKAGYPLFHRLIIGCHSNEWTSLKVRWLALTLVEIKFARESTQVFHRLGHQTQLNASWLMSNNLLLTNEIQHMTTLKCFFWRFASSYLWGNLQTRLATRRKTLRQFNLQYLWLHVLASPFGQGLKGDFLLANSTRLPKIWSPVKVGTGVAGTWTIWYSCWIFG